MKYMLLLISEETDLPEPKNPQEMAAMMQPWWDYNAALTEAGVFVGGEALQPSRSTTTLRGSDKGASMTDGPFAETKEQVGGFYIIDCADLDEALAWARKCPALPDGVVEVRPVLNLPDAPG